MLRVDGKSVVVGAVVCGVVDNDIDDIQAGKQVTLFELEIARAVGHAEEWTVVLERAVIEAVDPSAALEAPNLLGKLLNEQLEELIPNVVSSLVWVLPLAGELPITHKLFIDYRVKPTKKYDEVYGSYRFLDRLYSYRDAFDLHVPRVGYEICAQMLSQQPGAQLCRADVVFNAGAEGSEVVAI
ncbi:unnamed protein product [Nippostrongylus brasiliensis]|uniref:RT_RNaseH_2 domain-containing protein n=1 Tax=Nippostrongylus brasiliensis TaxID=27835 RepID=A0A0N4YYG0_NIPBR|nr:unnamed protein product [Nippostrongylus brasiliensis]